MCTQRDPKNFSEEIYQRYTQETRAYLVEKVVPVIHQAKQNPTAFLQAWSTKWQKHNLVVRGLSKLFMYLDRFHVPSSEGTLSLKQEGFRLFKELVFDEFHEIAAEYILNAIGREREHEHQDRQLLKSSVQVFIEIGYEFEEKGLSVYQNKLEKKVFEHAQEYYKRQSQAWLDGDSCPNYLVKVEECLNAESDRVDAFLNQSSMKGLQFTVYQELLQYHQLALLTKATGLEHMLESHRTEDLSRLYRLYSPYENDLPAIAKILQDYVAEIGVKVVDKASTPEEKSNGGSAQQGQHSLVQSLIEFHGEYADIVEKCLGDNPIFKKALKAAFEGFINKDNRVSKQLARFVNDVLKKHSKINTSDLNSTLDNVVFLYGYISEKDVFERDYQIFLADRLLNDQCESEHSEKSMIAKLKTECGYQWTNKLEGMFKDVTLAKEQMRRFKKIYDTEKILGMSFDVNVCTSGMWPSSKYVACRIPPELEESCSRFTQFYLSEHSGQKLEWRCELGEAEVQVLFAKGLKRTLTCTTYMMMVLLCFNSASTLSLQQILEITGLSFYDIADSMFSLAHPNTKVLLKKPNVKTLEPTDMFKLNPKFQSQLLKVTIPSMRYSVNNKRRDEEENAIQKQRKNQMDAAIVRIMKTRKTLRHNRLVAEVMQQLQARFKPKPQMIKKRIEALIEQEYMERDPDNRGVYNYLA